jgi:hypothetical protein
MVLYDPDPNTVQLMPHDAMPRVHKNPPSPSIVAYVPQDGRPAPTDIVVYTGKPQGFFDDASMRTVHELFLRSGCHHLLFASDIRVEATEDRIAVDMRDQQRWAIASRCSMYVFKFRIPYKWSESIRRAYFDDLHRLQQADPAADKTRFDHTGGFIPYLDGDLHIQLYGRQQTAELRMIGARAPDGTYRFKKYPTVEIEDKMALFNTVYRNHVQFSHPGADAHVSAYFKSYELVAEHAIVTMCIAARGLPTGDTDAAHKIHMAVFNLINANIALFIDKDAITCPLRTAADEIDKIDDATYTYLSSCANDIEAKRPGTIPRDLLRAINDRRAPVKSGQRGSSVPLNQKMHRVGL